MNHRPKFTSLLLLLLASGVAFTASRVSGQQPPAVKPGNAPGLKFTDLGHSPHAYRVNMVKGDEILSGLMEFAEKNHIKNAHFTGLGAIDKAVLRWADPVHQKPRTNEVNEEAEIVSLTGTIEPDNNGKLAVHAHIVVGLSDGTTRGGHLVEGHVSVVCEVFVVDEEGPGETR